MVPWNTSSLSSRVFFIILKKLWNYRSSQRRCYMNKDVLKNFAKFTWKHLCQSFFLNKVAVLNFIKKRLWHRCFPVNFANFLKNTFSTEHLRGTASETICNLTCWWMNDYLIIILNALTWRSITGNFIMLNTVTENKNENHGLRQRRYVSEKRWKY